MNLLDQKLKEKLKLFDNIDKECSTQILSSRKTMKKNSKTKFPTSNLTSEQFNEIYSNFLLDNNNKSQINELKTTNTHSHKNSLNEMKIKNIVENRINNKDNNNNIKTPSKSTKRSKSKDLSNYIPPNDCGNRLYNYGFYLKNKLEKQRKEENEKIQKQMTPKILPKSKEIFRDSSFESRLYYNNDSNDNFHIYKKKEISKDNSYEDHKPRLNKKSLEIANKLEPSSQRLMKKKKKYTNEKSKNKDIYNNIYYNNHSKSNSISPSEKEHLKRCNELYNKGIENMMKREQIYKETKMKKEEEYKNYSFKPKITKNSPVVEKNTIIKSTSPSGKNNIMTNLYKKQCEWKKKLENENLKKREKIDNQTKQDCTFKPEISHLKIQNDEKFIMVNRRREVIEKQKEYEKYKRKRLGEDVSSFECKPTIPRKFELKTEERSRSHSKEQNNHERKNSVNRIIKDINIEREEMNTFGFFNNVVNNFGYNVNNGNNNLAQQEFIDAVNALHSKIDNLNI